MSKLAEEILKVSRSWKPDGVNFPLTDEKKLALIDEKLSDVRKGLFGIMGDSVGQGFGDKILNERLKNIDTIVVQLLESLKVD